MNRTWPVHCWYTKDRLILCSRWKKIDIYHFQCKNESHKQKLNTIIPFLKDLLSFYNFLFFIRQCSVCSTVDPINCWLNRLSIYRWDDTENYRFSYCTVNHCLFTILEKKEKPINVSHVKQHYCILVHNTRC